MTQENLYAMQRLEDMGRIRQMLDDINVYRLADVDSGKDLFEKWKDKEEEFLDLLLEIQDQVGAALRIASGKD